MKKIIRTLFLNLALSAASSAAVILYDDPGNYLPDSYWPDLPGASNMGGTAFVTFSGGKQGFYVTSHLSGNNTNVVIFHEFSRPGANNVWRLELLANSQGQLQNLEIGEVVGAGGMWISNLTANQDVTAGIENNFSITTPETTYFGFRRVNDSTGETQYGWAEFKTVPLRPGANEETWAYFGESSAGIKFTRNAYETDGNSIVVGQTVSVPEPSLALLASIGVLVGTYRRSR
jgi:hypothetical protein